MFDSQIEEIKNKLNVVDVVGSYIKLSKTGANYRGVCPFHSEKKPSFFVSPSRQLWHCFGCGAGSSIFDFVMKIEGVEFGDALRILANKAGVQLKKENPKLRTERQRLYEICELACAFFEKQLGNSSWGKSAKEYLQKRGINDESIKKWRLGYSPDTWQSLSDFLVGKGYSRQEIVKAGLAVEKNRNKSDSYDRFRGRIIFPIFDGNSQVIGFGARVFKDAQNKEVAKYINTPQTLLYDKSNAIYGLNNAKLNIRKNNQCVITEGYTDAIMCHQAGFENTVAASGTALTAQHLNTLKRYSENLLLAFDMDLAGDSATKRGINLAENQGFNIKVIDTYSRGEDPADIVVKNPENWKKCLEEARSIMDFYFDSALSAYDKNAPSGKKEIGKIVLPAIKRLPNKIEQSYWVQKLSQKLSVREEAILDELKNVKTPDFQSGYKETKSSSEVGEMSSGQGRKKIIEEKIISLVLKDPENLNLIEQEHFNLFSGKARQFIESLKNGAALENLAEFAFRAEVSADFEDDGPEEIQLCLLQLKDIELRNELSQLSGAMQVEEDAVKKEDLMRQFDKKAKELHIKMKNKQNEKK